MALTLHEGLKYRGHRSWMAVGRRNIESPDIFAIPGNPAESRWARLVQEGSAALEPLVSRVRGIRRIQQGLNLLSNPLYSVDRLRGREHFRYPGTAGILDLPPHRPDVVHCHNLHGRYFDLRQLVRLSRSVPVVLTLHDEWAFTGHCAYTMGCERWRSGCGACPGLHIYPPVRRDATAANWRAKRAVYAASRLYVSTPSQWLMDRARESILFEGVSESRVIYNGVDRSVFRPADRAAARQRLGLPVEPRMLLFTANAARRNMFKDYETVREAVRICGQASGDRPLLLIALGDTGPSERFGSAELRFVPYEESPALVAAYYQAADLYLHGAKADNLPTTIVEALASAVPVIATAVGGISEQVRSLADAPGGWAGPAVPRDQATGVLVQAGDAAGMAAAALALLADDDLRACLSANAARDAAERFDLRDQVENTVAWYQEVLRGHARDSVTLRPMGP